jgi:hypothetical protein
MIKVVNGKLNPELGLVIEGNLDLRGTDIVELPENLSIIGFLDLEKTNISKLSENLTVGGFLDVRNTSITELPKNLTVSGLLELRGTNITNHPVVYNCGYNNRAIYIDLEDKSLIRIGCFKGTKEEAIQAVTREYQNKNDRDLYINKINECFELQKKFV